jgi:hypothetical protein
VHDTYIVENGCTKVQGCIYNDGSLAPYWTSPGHRQTEVSFCHSLELAGECFRRHRQRARRKLQAIVHSWRYHRTEVRSRTVNIDFDLRTSLTASGEGVRRSTVLLGGVLVLPLRLKTEVLTQPLKSELAPGNRSHWTGYTSAGSGWRRFLRIPPVFVTLQSTAPPSSPPCGDLSNSLMGW